jgi:hypothetical protein
MRRALTALATVSLAVVVVRGAARAEADSRDIAPDAGASTEADAGLPAKENPVVRSNILRADYAGSESCRSCHKSLYDDWLGSPMRRMTRLPATAQIRAPFDGRTWKFKGDEARFEQKGAVRFVRLHTRRFGNHLYRITRLIGGRTREDFAGVEVTDSKPDAAIIGDAHDEVILPVSYFFETASFRLKGYSVMVRERPGLKAGAVWNQSCVLCHNTAPAFPALWGALLGKGAPSYQGEVVDALLPKTRRWRLQVTDANALTAAVADEVHHLGGTIDPPAGAPACLRQGIIEMRQRLGAQHLLEIGIGCEVCHGGCREHVQQPRVATSYQPRSPFLSVQPAPGHGPITRAEEINRACARCHQVLFSRYPFTWEGGRRHGVSPGGSATNSGEARDMLLGGCSRAMACTTCHDPHRNDDPDDLAALATPAGNATCTKCHPAYAGREAVRAHAHHDPDAAGGVCINCHMPRKNLALTYTLGRYHRIGSPTERARVEGDRPLECALCHARKSAEELVSTMERWWGKRYNRQILQTLYGDLQKPPLLSTLARGKPHEQAVAIISLGEQSQGESLPLVARQIANPLPLVRFLARKTIHALLGRDCGIDLNRSLGEIIVATEKCVPQAAPITPGAPMREAAASNPDDD